MRLRNKIAAPARFEDDYHSDRRPPEPTKPAYPELLSNATFPYNPKLPNVAWSTRPLDSSLNQGCQARQLEITGVFTQGDCDNTATATDARPAQISENREQYGRNECHPNLTTTNNMAPPFEGDFMVEMDTSSESGDDEAQHVPERVTWSELSLSMQLRIYVNICCLMSKNEAAYRLGLHTEELESMESHRNFRAIHNLDEEKFRATWLSHLLAIQQREDPSLKGLAKFEMNDSQWTQANNKYMAHMVHHCNYAYATDGQIDLAITYLQQRNLDLDLVGTWTEGSHSQDQHNFSQQPGGRTNSNQVKPPVLDLLSSETVQSLIEYVRENTTKERKEGHNRPSDAASSKIPQLPWDHIDRTLPIDIRTIRQNRNTSDDSIQQLDFDLDRSLPQNSLKHMQQVPHGLNQAILLRGGGIDDANMSDFERFKKRVFEAEKGGSIDPATPETPDLNDLACLKCGKTMQEGVNNFEAWRTWYRCNLCSEQEYATVGEDLAQRPPKIQGSLALPKLKMKPTGEAVVRKDKHATRQAAIAQGDLTRSEQPRNFENEMLRKKIVKGNSWKPQHQRLRMTLQPRSLLSRLESDSSHTSRVCSPTSTSQSKISKKSFHTRASPSTPTILRHFEPRAPSWSPISPDGGIPMPRSLADQALDTAENQVLGSIPGCMHEGHVVDGNRRASMMGDYPVMLPEGINAEPGPEPYYPVGPVELSHKVNQKPMDRTVKTLSLCSRTARKTDSGRLMAASTVSSMENHSFQTDMFGFDMLLPPASINSTQHSSEEPLNSGPRNLRSIPTSPRDQHASLVDSGLGTSRATSSELELHGRTSVQKTLDGASRKLHKVSVSDPQDSSLHSLKVMARLATTTEHIFPPHASPIGKSTQWPADPGIGLPSLPLISDLKKEVRNSLGGKGSRGPYKKTREKIMARQAAEEAAVARSFLKSPLPLMTEE